jgi:hypothetical protein
MVRRTYASLDPQYPARRVGDSIVHPSSRHIEMMFTKDEFEWYSAVSYESERLLVTNLDDGTNYMEPQTRAPAYTKFNMDWV